MSDHDEPTGGFAPTRVEVFGEPSHTFDVEMVSWLIEHDDVEILNQ